jgi:4-hydroxybenzoate polyprenyltransferase
MINWFYYLLKLLRPRQWIKNFALFAGVIFGGGLFDINVVSNVTVGFIIFCLLSSSTYIINDILDLKKDQLHPFKKLRPIAQGKISPTQATIVCVIMMSSAFILAAQYGIVFFSIAVIYIILQMLYSTIVKSISIFDILFIALGYMIRVFAGEIISNMHISVWLLLTTVCLSLFLAVAKRRSELTLLKNVTGSHISEVRKSLSHYSEPLLDAYAAIFATATLVFYTLFTFLEDPSGIKISIDLLLPEFLPYYLQRKWLMITIIPVIYGLMKYLQNIHEKSEGESPDKVLLSDKPLLASVLIWILLVIFIIYFIQ